MDTDAWIAQNTNDTRYYQPDGIHWTADFEAWLGLVTIQDSIGIPEQPPQLTFSLSNGVVTVGWSLRRYSTNFLQESSEATFTNPSVTETFTVLETSGVAVQRNATNAARYFRVLTRRLDFPTFYNLSHP
jgi:hypothetical protein